MPRVNGKLLEPIFFVYYFILLMGGGCQDRQTQSWGRSHWSQGREYTSGRNGVKIKLSIKEGHKAKSTIVSFTFLIRSKS